MGRKMLTTSLRAVAVLLFAGVALMAADPLAQLGISPKEAGEQLMSAITSGNTPYGPWLKAYKKLSSAARGTVAQDVMAWAKATTASPAFRTAYSTYRTSQKPEAPAFDGSVDAEFKRMQEARAAELAQTRKSFAALPAEQRKELEEIMKQSETMMKSPDMLKSMRDGIVSARQDQQERYQRALVDWQTAYPESPQPLVAKQLHRFLDASADVDFAATLVASGGSMRFANPQYESQSSDWKMCYRAGREAVGAARAAATTWIKEIEPGR